jgi:hypothetical protein
MEQYYLGKLCVENNELVYYEVKNSVRSEGIRFFVKDVKENPKNWTKVLGHKSNHALDEYVTEFHTIPPYQIISAKVGERYYQNGWSKSRGDELRNAVINYNKAKEDAFAARARAERNWIGLFIGASYAPTPVNMTVNVPDKTKK